MITLLVQSRAGAGRRATPTARATTSSARPVSTYQKSFMGSLSLHSSGDARACRLRTPPRSGRPPSPASIAWFLDGTTHGTGRHTGGLDRGRRRVAAPIGQESPDVGRLPGRDVRLGDGVS